MSTDEKLDQNEESFDERLSRIRKSLEGGTKERTQEAFPLAGLITLFDTALKLWLNKDKTKYVDRKIKLLKEWREEYNRPDRSRNALDRIDFELRILATAFIEQANHGEPAA